MLAIECEFTILCWFTLVQNSLKRTKNKPPYNCSSAEPSFYRAVRQPNPQQEGKPMVQAMSLFNQLLQHFPSS